MCCIRRAMISICSSCLFRGEIDAAFDAGADPVTRFGPHILPSAV